MGRAMAQNLAGNGFEVKAWDIDPGVLNQVAGQYDGASLMPSIEDLLTALAPPRLVLLFVPSGKPVDDTLEILRRNLRPGDIVADCGNSHYRDTKFRREFLSEKNIDFIGVGVSGGPKGARLGPAIMAGGNADAWEGSKDVFKTIAAKTEASSCCDYFGQDGAGHFVKMVHNGIEYGVMQLLAELFGYLEDARGLPTDEVASVFSALDQGRSAGYLTEVTSIVVAARTETDGRRLVDVIDDAAGQKGTGRWTVKAALDYGVAIPTIAEAVFARSLSGDDALRRDNPGRRVNPASRDVDALPTIEIDAALALAVACTFAQGLSLCQAVDDEFGAELDLIAILRTWRQGCILRSRMVNDLIDALGEKAGARNLFALGDMPNLVAAGLPALRSLTSTSIEAGVPMAAFASALAYVELLHEGPWPGRVIQLQRDYFGSHGLKDKITRDVVHGPWRETDAT